MPDAAIQHLLCVQTVNITYVYFNAPTTILGAKNETSKHVWKYRIMYEIPDYDFEIF